MTTPWAITLDCHDATVVMAFWKVALGYVDAPPPEGFDSWEAWLIHFQVPEEEWGDGGSLIDPAGVLPSVGFLKVPEGKTVKNRMHLDLRVSGGRQISSAVRRERILAYVERLVSAGATVLDEASFEGELDHVVLADPEGNELCVV
jgi:Glyoxalase-like domain